MKEIISIHLGQAGIQLGNSCWEMYCLEHGISPDGWTYGNDEQKYNGHKKFFSEVHEGKMVPRAIYLDLEPDVIDEVKTGKYRNLFYNDQLISGKEGSGHVYSRGEAVGKDKVEEAMNKIRKIADHCENLQGFMIYHSIGGGTGSSIGDSILSQLNSEFPNKTKFDMCVFPSASPTTPTVEPYNSVLSIHNLVEQTDFSLILDNEAIQNICKSTLGINSPTFNQMNRVVARMVGAVTESIRSDGTLNSELNEFVTNLVPYPRVHFIIPSFAPFVKNFKSPLNNYSENFYNLHNISSPSVEEIGNSIFENSNSFTNIDKEKGKSMSACLMYRGDCNIKEINQSITSLKKNQAIQFVDWSPIGIKVCLNKSLPIQYPGWDFAKSDRDLVALDNSTSISQIFSKIKHRFDLMFDKRAFVQQFCCEGMPYGSFVEAREDLASLILDYEEVCGEDFGDDEDQY